MADVSVPIALEQKRQAAIQYLGSNWVLHQDYSPNPRHSNDPEIYEPARRSFLRGIGERASVDRITRNH